MLSTIFTKNLLHCWLGVYWIGFKQHVLNIARSGGGAEKSSTSSRRGPVLSPASLKSCTQDNILRRILVASVDHAIKHAPAVSIFTNGCHRSRFSSIFWREITRLIQDTTKGKKEP
ncbi:uncharacterized protein LOC143232858 [Tachypleus tridentatus]|uniref:uncharacterized protein LOC143232858 n=1 Tax=Tachypleus tridentatus TaxID=6853 RepID=UPI003FD0D75A